MKRKKLLILIIVLCIVVVAIFVGLRIAKNKITSIAADTIVEQVFADTDISVEDIDEEDKQIIEEICSEYVTVDTVTDIMEIADDEAAVEEYVYSILSEDEVNQLMEIYAKYSEGVVE